MFDTDDEIIAFALNAWGNYIETHCVSMSASDALERVYVAQEWFEPNHLTSSQKKLVGRIRNLANEFGKS